MKPYLSYLHLQEKINQDKNLIAVYKLKPEKEEDFHETAGGIASESSVGTWTKVSTEIKSVWDRLHARVFEINEDFGLIKIAYSLELFEPGNIPQLLSSVAGNVFGLKEINSLKLLDLLLPEKYVKSFLGPAIGADGIRKITGVYDRPLTGSIIKPKLGLSSIQHFEAAMAVFKGGVDLVKDDENLTNQAFNLFQKRTELILKGLKETGLTNKIYAFNITGSTKIMNERAKLVKDLGGN
ncbi:ribulose-bisphosphate carboxylase large subunit, partial [Candidatus Microgenomates bacterium]|nr:ribulose-bisphosphate carboxylase large subunit [Candidatus Microgenomates bacterium]